MVFYILISLLKLDMELFDNSRCARILHGHPKDFFRQDSSPKPGRPKILVWVNFWQIPVFVPLKASVQARLGLNLSIVLYCVICCFHSKKFALKTHKRKLKLKLYRSRIQSESEFHLLTFFWHNVFNYWKRDYRAPKVSAFAIGLPIESSTLLVHRLG